MKPSKLALPEEGALTPSLEQPSMVTVGSRRMNAQLPCPSAGATQRHPSCRPPGFTSARRKDIGHGFTAVTGKWNVRYPVGLVIPSM